MTLGKDGLYSSGVDKIGEECMQQIRGLEMNVEIPEGKNVSKLTLESIRIPSRLPTWSVSLDKRLKLSSDQISSRMGSRSGIQGKDPKGLKDPSPKKSQLD